MLSAVSNIVPSTDTSSFKSVLSRDDISIDWNFTGFASKEFSLNHFRRVSMSEVKVFFNQFYIVACIGKAIVISIIKKESIGIEKKYVIYKYIKQKWAQYWTLWNTLWNRIPFTPGGAEFDSLMSNK